MPFEFATAARIIFGSGTVAQLPGITQTFGEKALLVTGRDSARVASAVFMPSRSTRSLHARVKNLAVQAPGTQRQSALNVFTLSFGSSSNSEPDTSWLVVSVDQSHIAVTHE